MTPFLLQYTVFLSSEFDRKIMLCTVTRTHYMGEKRPDRDPGPTVTGTVRMYSIMRADMKRYIRAMTMDDRKAFGTMQKAEIPEVRQPEFPTFSSDHGSMACGFEKAEGRRSYQGWWMHEK
ncbi:hypothetical protein [Achromobacter sp. PAB15]|uniref:hypothetical protein n=1 Tax=Achromobacter sp. PAB15 TaxID=3233048 RepID=UPI003F8F2870